VEQSDVVRALVRALFAAFAARDVEAALRLVDPKADFWPQGTAEAAGQTEPYRGHDGLRQYFADVEEHWRELEIHPGELRVAGTGVVSFGTARGVRRDGTVMDVPVIWTFKLRQGRVIRARVVTTAAEAHEDLRQAS
jgi:ketosteroid isomerase-like protein